MKTLPFYFFVILTMLYPPLFSQPRDTNDDENGDWSEQFVTLYNTPEAELMVRSGDIDNLGFGWPSEFNPFSGNSTPSHGYPWTADTTDASGTDRIMVVSSYNGNPPHWQDGYTSNTSRPENLPRPILLTFDLGDINVTSAALQIFVDDFQAGMWGANYFVTLNGVDAPYMATVVNSLNQTGPVGKIINVAIPEEHLYLLESDSLSVLFDDTITGAGDGYAIDFVKLLVNLKGFSYTAKVYGNVTVAGTDEPIANAVVKASGIGEVYTDADGYYMFDSLPAGINNIFATKFSYDTTSVLVDLNVGDSVRRDFQLTEILDAEFTADEPIGYNIPHTVHFTDQTSMNPTEWHWDFGDGTSSEEQNPTHEYTNSGTFTVSLTASNGEETNTEIKTDYILIVIDGVDEYLIVSGLSVNPNPAVGHTTICFDLYEACHVHIDMIDLTGKVVLPVYHEYTQRGEHKISCTTSHLNEGVYFLHLQAGTNHFSKKIIVMR